MVSFEEVVEESPTLTPSQERMLDAEEIAAMACKRPTAKMHLTSLAKKLRKESEALKRLEDSQMKSASTDQSATSTEAPKETPTPAAPVAPSPPMPVPVKVAPPPASSSVKYTPIDSFAFDAGEYNSPFVTLYISLPGVGSLDKENNIECKFGTSDFDLIVKDLRGKSYRLVKTNLEKDIDPEKSKYIVKADKIIIKLAKIKGEYGSYDYWSKLTDPKRNEKKNKSSSDPSSSIMDLMKDMYDSGDDQMRKMIGETMMKQNRGELGKGADMGLGNDI
jgi:calcyclin binding protein